MAHGLPSAYGFVQVAHGTVLCEKTPACVSAAQAETVTKCHLSCDL